MLQFFWEDDIDGRPLLAALCACARDPILRMTAEPVLAAKPGELVTKLEVEEVVERYGRDRFNSATLNKIARNALSSRTQSGHVEGRTEKKRMLVHPTAATLAYAVLLGYLFGGVKGL